MSRAPLPEARGSHAAAVIEINRAVAYSAKAASKERRRAKKIAKAKRKIAEKARERMTSAATAGPVSVGTRCYGSPLPDDIRNTIRRACNEHGLLAVYNLINRAAPKRTRDAVVSALVYVRDDRPSGRVHPFAKSWQYDFAVAARILDTSGMPPAPKSDGEIRWPLSVRRVSESEPERQQPLGDQSRKVEEDPRFDRIHNEVDSLKEEMVRINENLRLLVGKTPAASAPKEPTTEERITYLIVEASREDRLDADRWSKLYSTFALGETINFKQRAEKLGISTKDDGWTMRVAREDGTIDRLLILAQRLFANG